MILFFFCFSMCIHVTVFFWLICNLYTIILQLFVSVFHIFFKFLSCFLYIHFCILPKFFSSVIQFLCTCFFIHLLYQYLLHLLLSFSLLRIYFRASIPPQNILVFLTNFSFRTFMTFAVTFAHCYTSSVHYHWHLHHCFPCHFIPPSSLFFLYHQTVP